MLTIVKEENGFTIERYIDDDGDIEKFNKLIALKKYFFINNTISEMLTRFGKAPIKAKKDKLAMSGNRGSLEKFEFKPY